MSVKELLFFSQCSFALFVLCTFVTILFFIKAEVKKALQVVCGRPFYPDRVKQRKTIQSLQNAKEKDTKILMPKEEQKTEMINGKIKYEAFIIHTNIEI